MNFQKAVKEDLQGIIALQRKNFIKNLTELEKKDGFLSVEFTEKQFMEMNEQSGIIVCKEDTAIYGYLCTSTPKFNRSFKLPSAMYDLYPQHTYKGKSLDQYPSLVVGPWCIERSCRGKNIFISMWGVLDTILPKEIELLTTFISIDNTRSLSAAIKVGMDKIATFQFDAKDFYLLAMLVNQ